MRIQFLIFPAYLMQLPILLIGILMKTVKIKPPLLMMLAHIHTGNYLVGSNQLGNALLKLGLDKNDRVAMVMLDSIEFPSVFWGAIKAGVIPVPLNTLLTTAEYEFILNDSGATILIVSETLYPVIEPVISNIPELQHIIISGEQDYKLPLLSSLLHESFPELKPADSYSDDIAFWLYSSGSTGNPKGVMHRHENLYHTAKLYGKGVLGIREDDTVYSAAKLFFAYGPWKCHDISTVYRRHCYLVCRTSHTNIRDGHHSK